MRVRHILLLLLSVAPAVGANDFPTRARVEFVLECMKESNLPQQEALYKCSCAIDAIAEKVHYNKFVELSTIANGMTIAGERGGVMRDMKGGRGMVTSFRELKDGAKRNCFLPAD